jgi:hypothetical protein
MQNAKSGGYRICKNFTKCRRRECPFTLRYEEKGKEGPPLTTESHFAFLKNNEYYDLSQTQITKLE